MNAFAGVFGIVLPFLAVGNVSLDRVAWGPQGQIAIAYTQSLGRTTTVVVDLVEDKELVRRSSYDASEFDRPKWKDDRKPTFSDESDFYVDGRRTVVFLDVQFESPKNDRVLGYKLRVWNFVNQEKVVTERTFEKTNAPENVELLGTLKSPLEPRLALLVVETRNGERNVVVYGSHTGIGFR